MDEKYVKELSGKLDIVIKLLAQGLIAGKKPTESIKILGQLGLERNTIAHVVGATPATVSVRLSEQKKKKGRKPTTQKASRKRR